MDATALGDLIAAKVRRWYEANRESWWDRLGVDPLDQAEADSFMLALIEEVRRATAEVMPPPMPAMVTRPMPSRAKTRRGKGK